MTTRPCALLIAAIMGCASHASIASAQVESAVAQPATAAPEGQSAATAEPQDAPEIIVTAQKRSERLIDVPMSISVVSGEQLVKSGIVSTVNLQQTTPGLVTVNNGFGFLPLIRGIASSGTSPGDALNVAIYLDDISVGAPIAGFFDLSDIERIEVLKGPQGTLFGRNATGGAIRIITRTPSFNTSGNVSADYGIHFNELRLNGYVTTGLSDTLAASLSGSVRKGRGFIGGSGPNAGRYYGAPDNYLVRGKLLFRPSTRFEAVLALDTFSQQNDSVFISEVNNDVNPFPSVPGVIPSTTNRYAGSTQPKADLHGWGTSLDAHWEATDDITLRSLTGFRRVQVVSQSDTDRTSLSGTYVFPTTPATSVTSSWNALNQYENAFSQEFNLSGGSATSPFTWLLGGYYFHGSAGNPYFRQGLGDAQGFTGLPSTSVAGSRITSNFTNNVKTEAIAAFGEITYNVTPELHLTGGLRYNTERKDFHYQQLILGGVTNTTVYDQARRWNSATYRAVARYDLAPNANVYVSVSNGFKSGVFNGYSPTNPAVNPEKIQAYEIGAKVRAAGITFTGAAYAYDYKDIQLSSYVTVNGTLTVALSNATKAKMRGVEFTADGNIGGGFSFNAGVSYEPKLNYGLYNTALAVTPLTAAEIAANNANPATAGINKASRTNYNATGSQMVRAPKVTANGRINYAGDVGGGKLNANVNGSYTGKFFWQPGNLSPENPYFLLNARLAWTQPDERVTYSIFGNNLTNKLYHTDLVANTRGDDSVKYAPQAEYGVGISVTF
ncbi:TonB-dependent receptor [Sphingomonas sp. Leaf357]|uniref:TonB-dependent receptor n=1 Tax=Sphingomonas sp. Leaf357 TaxID=1736350 RepID=UPI000AAB606F|nr:TonB-dependent receptor [Sphingomonas sp. Leaf357]